MLGILIIDLEEANVVSILPTPEKTSLRTVFLFLGIKRFMMKMSVACVWDQRLSIIEQTRKKDHPLV